MQPFDSHVAFRKAVHDLADEPTHANALRYLVASRLLDRAAEARPARGSARNAARKLQRAAA